MKIMDVLLNFSGKNFKRLGLEGGQIVVDYACGPARYIKPASEAVGKNGKVIAVDVHPLAITKVNQVIEKFDLTNVEPVLAKGYQTSISDEVADVIYALDVFHMVKKPKEFLLEMSRILKPNGIVIIENGHQSRAKTIRKIKASNLLYIVEENKYHLKCKKK